MIKLHDKNKVFIFHLNQSYRIVGRVLGFPLDFAGLIFRISCGPVRLQGVIPDHRDSPEHW